LVSTYKVCVLLSKLLNYAQFNEKLFHYSEVPKIIVISSTKERSAENHMGCV